jgi:hypothetical protein
MLFFVAGSPAISGTFFCNTAKAAGVSNILPSGESTDRILRSSGACAVAAGAVWALAQPLSANMLVASNAVRIIDVFIAVPF